MTVIDKIRIASPSGVAGQTTITDARTGEPFLCTDAKLYIEDGHWCADIKMPHIEFDIEATVKQRAVVCLRCRAVQHTDTANPAILVEVPAATLQKMDLQDVIDTLVDLGCVVIAKQSGRPL